jgi:UDP:flavonoid glycosyltransferase YjiC (YdhE family)
MARLVIFTSGTLGDHLPYLALAQGLKERGHDVLMVINQAMHKYAERVGLQAVSLTDIERGPEEARENAWAWDHWRNPWHAAQSHPKAKTQPPELFVQQIKELVGFLKGADLLLATAIRPHGLAAHLVCDVPWVTLSVNPSAFIEPSNSVEQEQAFGAERIYYNGIRPILDRAVREGGSQRFLPGWYRGCLWSPHVILGSSPTFFQPNLKLLQPFASIEQTGFWYWEDPAWKDWRPSPDLESFCQQSPLVLTFSSQPLEDPGEILVKHARAAAKIQKPLLVQRGWANFLENDLPTDVDPSQVFFLDYAPHDWLFARASVAIQHGGIGSLARAIRQYCPVIVEPFGNDQFFNAQRAVELGVGGALNPFEATEDDIVSAIEGALSKRVRLRVRLLGRTLREEDGVAVTTELIDAALARRNGAITQDGLWGQMPLSSTLANEEIRPTTKQTIPHIIHHTWKDEQIPDHFRAWYDSWHIYHPDWQFRLWTDDDCRDLIVDHYAWFLPIYDAYTDQIKRVDAARYFILHHYGGVYVDLDYEALRPLEPLLEGSSLVLTNEPPVHLQRQGQKRFLNQMISNAFMASVPGHAFWEHVFELLAAWRDAPGPLDATGPFLLSRAFDSYDGDQEITVEAYQRLCPIGSDEQWLGLPPETQELISRDAYAIHHWFGSWWVEPITTDRPALVQLISSGQTLLGSQLTTREQLLEFSAKLAKKPVISCLMVTRERPLLAQLAIHSFLSQSYSPRELIIIDDGPDDRLQNWLAVNSDDRIRYYHLQDEGRSLGELRTWALNKARGEFVTQWDDDDLSAPLRLELQMAIISLFGVSTCLLMRHMLWVPSAGSLAKSTYRLWEGSAVFAKEAISAYPAQQQGEDTAVIEHIVAQNRVVLLDMPELYLYTFHGSNTFTAEHWLQHLQQATVRYQGFRYDPALTELQKWFGIKFRQLGAYLAGTVVQADQKPLARPDKIAIQSSSPEPFVEQEPINTAVNETALAPLLILTPLKDAAPYLENYLANLRKLDYPPELLSLGFLESDSRDDTVALVEEVFPDLRQQFRRITFLRRDYGLQLDAPRWETGMQRLRRSVQARSRNALLQGSLKDESWVLWIDVDVIDWPADIINRLLASDKRIVTPNCLHARSQDSFDLNSFKLAPGAEDLDWSPYLVDGLLQPPRGFGRLYLSDLRDQDMVELDGVGGTMLLVDADLHRDGLIFPPVIYKGFIETEGLAQMARDMGVSCWGLPNVIIRHT